MARKPTDGPLPIKQGDTSPSAYILCEDENGPVPLLGAEVTFRMRQVDGAKFVEGAAVAVDAAATEGEDAGWVRYDWSAGDTDTPGVYHAEVTVLFAPGAPNEREETFPSGLDAQRAYMTVLVRARLAA